MYTKLKKKKKKPQGYITEALSQKLFRGTLRGKGFWTLTNILSSSVGSAFPLLDL